MILLLAVPENNNENSSKLVKNVKAWSHFLADFPCHAWHGVGGILSTFSLPSFKPNGNIWL